RSTSTSRSTGSTSRSGDAGAARWDTSCGRFACSSGITRRCRGARSAHEPMDSRSSTRRSPTPRRCVFPRRLSNLIRAASERRPGRDVLRDMLTIGTWTFAFRVVSALIALLVNLAFPLHQREQFTVFGSTSPFWDTFARYDSGYFEGIAWDGYAPLAGGRSNIAYFPMYPLLIRYVARLFGRHHATYFIAAIGVAWVCFVLAMVALYYLARLDLDRRQAERAVLLTAIFPFAFFFGVAYSESTFLLFAVLAFYLFRTRRWLLGGVCGAVATATRVPGILILPPLAWVALSGTSPSVPTSKH